MKTRTFDHLQRLRGKYGPGIFGKIVQKLLALAFYNIGAPHVVERGVQGVDIDVETSEGEKYALEVKTTDSDAVPITRENLDALADRANDGYAPLIAALRMKMFEDWIIASIPLSQLQPGSFPLRKLRAYRLKLIEASVSPSFEAIVNEHATRVLAEGEGYLINVLTSKRE